MSDDDSEQVKSGTLGTFIFAFILIVTICVVNTACIIVSLFKYYTHEWKTNRKQKQESGQIWVDIVAWVYLCTSFIFQIVNSVTIPLERFHVIKVTESYCWGIIYFKFTLSWVIMQIALFMFWWLRLYYVFADTVHAVSKNKFKAFIVFIHAFAIILQTIWLTRMFVLFFLSLFISLSLFVSLCFHIRFVRQFVDRPCMVHNVLFMKIK